MGFSTELSKEVITDCDLLLVYIDNNNFLNNSLKNLMKKLRKKDYDLVSQEFNAGMLGLVKKKEFFPQTTRRALKELKKVYLAKLILYFIEISDEDYEHVVIVRKIFRTKNMKDYHDFHLKF